MGGGRRERQAITWLVWQTIYICVSGLLLLTTKGLYRHAAVSLVFWQILGFTIQQQNVVETVGRSAAAAVFTSMVLVLWCVHKRPIFLFLVGVGACGFLWALFYEGDPYNYKAGLNVFWLIGVFSVWKSSFSQSRLLRRMGG